MKRIVLTGGGSGGHIYPLLAVAQAMKEIEPDVRLDYLGPRDRYSEILAGEGIRLHRVASSKVRRYASGFLQNLLDVPKFFWGGLQSLAKMFWLMPDAVFSKGGPGALPVVLAAWFYGIPVIIHESDAAPGLTNLLSGRFAKVIAVSFERAAKYFDPNKILLTGNPVRRELAGMKPSREQAKSALRYDPGKPLLLVLGGSQGSQRINDFIAVILPQLLKVTQILHQTGEANIEDVKRLTKTQMLDMPVRQEAEFCYEPVPYVEDMNTALAAADLIISRASSAIFEFAAYGRPAILIPLLESANDHQRANAFEYAKTGAAIVVEEPNLLPALFVNQVKDILTRPETAEKMSRAAEGFARKDAAQAIAGAVLGSK